MMFGTILISICTLVHAYVFWRIATVPAVAKHLSRRVIIGAGVVLWTIFLLGRIMHENTGSLAATLEMVGMSWMGILFLTFVSLLAADLVTGFDLVMPRLAPSLRGWGLIVGVLLSVTALFQGIRPPVIRNYVVDLSGLSAEMEGTVIIAMSDMHLGSVLGEKWLEDRVAQVRAQSPDMILLLGDIVEGHGPVSDKILSDLGRLSAPLGVWAVPGNHEFHGDGSSSRRLIESGIRVLRNDWAEVAPKLILAGVEDLTARKRNGQSEDVLTKTLSGRPPGGTILLSHTPWQADRAARAGAGLMLSGHTHGGQIWPFGYIVRFIYPLLEGRYEVNGMPVLVCRGTGTWGPRMRLWRPGEILRVTLTKG